MKTKNQYPFTLKRQFVDVPLTGAVWVFFSIVLRAHVPSEDPFWITVWACVSAVCLSGVFYIALQMFRSVLHDTREE